VPFDLLARYEEDAAPKEAFFCRHRRSVGGGFASVFFGPCTLHGTPGQVVRTWGTRPGKWASLFGQVGGIHKTLPEVCDALQLQEPPAVESCQRSRVFLPDVKKSFGS
jgi:hypothetical protein